MEPKTEQAELVLNMYLDKLMILQPSELTSINAYNYFDADAPCQLYFVCRRPTITVDPRSFKATRDKMELVFKVLDGGNIADFDFVFENPFHTSALSIESDPPYSSFSISKNNEPLISVKTSAFLQSFPQELTNAGFLDLEILYVGQTIGVDGAGVAPGKLKHHQTLQSICDASAMKNPHHEICLLLASFQPHNLIMTDGRKKYDANHQLEAHHKSLHTRRALNTSDIPYQQLINITEAALIRYFEPPYNAEFKNIFPNPAQDTYSGCYDLNIYSIGIELDTYGIANCHIYSQKIEPKWLHMKTFLFHSSDERKSIFDISTSNVGV